jgi:hypothetical protein
MTGRQTDRVVYLHPTDGLVASVVNGPQRAWRGRHLWTGVVRNKRTLLLDSRVLCDQQLNKRRKQRFASLADVVHKLEEPQVQREFLLGDAPMRTKPTA